MSVLSDPCCSTIGSSWGVLFESCESYLIILLQIVVLNQSYRIRCSANMSGFRMSSVKNVKATLGFAVIENPHFAT